MAVRVLVVGELDDAVGPLPDVTLHLVLIQLYVLARPLLGDGVDALRLLQGFPPYLNNYISKNQIFADTKNIYLVSLNTCSRMVK